MIASFERGVELHLAVEHGDCAALGVAAREAPTDSLAHAALAAALLRAGRRDAAQRALDRARVVGDPAAAPLIALLSGHPPALEASPPPTPFGLLVAHLSLLGSTPHIAVPVAEALIDAVSASWVWAARSLRAQALMHAFPRAAFEEAERVLEMRPGTAPALHVLAHTAQGSERSVVAVHLRRRVLHGVPTPMAPHLVEHAAQLDIDPH